LSDLFEREVSRRNFLAGSIAGLGMAGVPAWFAKEAEADTLEAVSTRLSKKYSQNDQINIAVIGPGGSKGGYQQGLNDTKWIASSPGVKCVAVCDLEPQHRDEAAAFFGSDTKKYSDFREVLADKSIDAVVIGTPDHWHAVIASAAMKAGKDVYCEKPLTLTIDQGKKLTAVWKKTGRVFQTGSQQRSNRLFRLTCELVRNGRLGKIKHVITHLPTAPSGGPFQPKPVPEGFDWDMWLGPAPYTEYMPERVHGVFRWWLDYSGGMMTDWGAHHNDIMQWGLGMDRSGPLAVEAVGERRAGRNCYDIFQQFNVTYTYPDDVTVLCTNKGENGLEFHGENGWIFVSRGVLRASDQKLLDEPLPESATRLYKSDDHAGNFVEGIRTRKQCICDCEIGHRSVSVCHIGNICLRNEGRRLEWDPIKEEFKNDPLANMYLARPMRKGWKV
jgi:predicted dehydrogenase